MPSKIKILGLFLLLIALGGNMLSFAAQDQQKGKIFVNGTELEGESAWFISEEYESNDGCRQSVQVYETVELPFTAILKAYGFEVEWLDDIHARISMDDKIFELNLERVEVTEKESDFNYLVPAPGSRRSYTLMENELYLDYITTKSFLFLANDDRILIDTDQQALRVDVTF